MSWCPILPFELQGRNIRDHWATQIICICQWNHVYFILIKSVSHRLYTGIWNLGTAEKSEWLPGRFWPLSLYRGFTIVVLHSALRPLGNRNGHGHGRCPRTKPSPRTRGKSRPFSRTRTRTNEDGHPRTSALSVRKCPRTSAVDSTGRVRGPGRRIRD